jgi:hypothetical protein
MVGAMLDGRPRPRRAALLVLAIVSFLFAPARVALAQPAPPPPPDAAAAGAASAVDEAVKAQAKEAFFRGVEHFQNESWDAALAEFLRSRELYATPVAVKNAAVCLRQLRRYAEALDMYEELLSKFGSQLKPEDKKAAEEALAALQASVGELMITSDPAGCTVIVDGQERGTTPLPEAIRLNAGTHGVRVYKEGYEPLQREVVIAGTQRVGIDAKLKALAQSGKLIVVEASGQKLDVVVDGAVVGQTPRWEGTLAVGTHTVFLRGADDVGTPPSAATVFANQTSNLSLRATKLDAELRVEPVPSNARVDIDGVQVGSGVWEGRLKSGTHKVEVTAEGFLAYRKDVTVSTGKREVLRVALERDLTNPMWKEAFRPHLYADLVGGAAWAPAFGGSADGACAKGECSDRSRPLGLLAGVRGGYQLTSGLGIELFVGYLYMKESMTRELEMETELGDKIEFRSTEYEDTTSIGGPAAALAASYQFFEKTPLVVRAWAGAARVRAIFTNGGTFSGECLEEPDFECDDDAPPRAPVDRGGPLRYEEEIKVAEKTHNIWVPFVGPEVSLGYRFGERVMVALGVPFFVMLAPETKRVKRSGEERTLGLPQPVDPDPDNPPDAPPALGNVQYPIENGFGTFFVIAPNLHARFDF